eukprot:Protomagalhaensia_wolfi_Nauph_80__1759@NODE_2097_length_1214_cov_50_747234_g1638_i0_p2_GENE_NODE_2097_length_1214_cov_50_747234_g1638_i0NODE_2097_length_1214_cov_50_747234_g1638_i0_p2_ORF_typecomplete_len110_score3_80DUF4236/PF14020_6/0_16_NODE_2097_length_1214_cov_50_747234_g1638_i07241053
MIKCFASANKVLEFKQTTTPQRPPPGVSLVQGNSSVRVMQRSLRVAKVQNGIGSARIRITMGIQGQGLTELFFGTGILPSACVLLALQYVLMNCVGRVRRRGSPEGPAF